MLCPPLLRLGRRAEDMRCGQQAQVHEFVPGHRVGARAYLNAWQALTSLSGVTLGVPLGSLSSA